ncbi:MAG: hypothetical protein OK438_08405 [Thaumarchaeota archaeon]|nr:hypothetical protein [Nitrososphaerota archaeon]
MPLASGPSIPIYDEQLGLTFTQTFTSLAYNVTAIVQQESDGYGPAYLLNGLGDTGYWYQVGISWDWCGAISGFCTGYTAGFNMNYEVFNSTGSSVDPANGGGITQLSGSVSNGDVVLLNLYFSGGSVVLRAKDWNTGATASETYTAAGSTQFIGLSVASNNHGFFTGLMTEWYHQQPFHSNVERTEYSDPSFALSSATMWIDEFNANTSALLFGQASGVVNYTPPGTILSYTLSDATEYSNAYLFITGPLTTAFTLSYTVVGGGSGYSAPVLTYMSSGQVVTTSLSTASNTYQLDYGTSWSVSAQLPGSGSSERWNTGQSVSGTALASETLALTYTHQYTLSVSGGDRGPGVTGWYDAGSLAQATSAGVYGRSSGAGFRVTSYSVDGGNQVAVGPTLALVTVSLTVDSPHTVSFSSVGQYQLELGQDAPNTVASLTSPQVPNDVLWYDSGTDVTAVFHYVWNMSGTGSRYNVVSMTVNGQQRSVARAGSGTFSLSLVMSSAQAVALQAVRQYSLDASGGQIQSVSPQSSTSDSWFDGGSSVILTAADSWNTTAFASRMNLASYSIDGTANQVTRNSSGMFILVLQMNAPHIVIFNGERQFFISYSFWDASKSVSIRPQAFNINSSGTLQPYNRSSFWADASGTITITGIVWEGIYVNQAGNLTSVVSGPERTSLTLRVYDLKVGANDPLGLAVSGASVSVRLSMGPRPQGRLAPTESPTLGWSPLGHIRLRSPIWDFRAASAAMRPPCRQPTPSSS